ncbi:MAG: 50S ribosomal protein L25 [Thermomicrobiales bacterium]
MANELTLRAEPRTVHGKKVSRLRREGLVPGVVYGPVVPETISVSVNRRDFEKFYMTNGHSTVFTLTWDGGKQPVIIREVQVDPVSRVPLHIDFFAPNMRVVLRQSVPVVLHNPSPDAVGVLQTSLTEVEVEALPADLPHQLEGDLSGLVHVGDALRVADLKAPEKVTIITDGEEVIASLVPQATEEAPEGEAETEEGAAEAASTEAEAPAEDASSED